MAGAAEDVSSTVAQATPVDNGSMGADRWIDSFCRGANPTGPDYAQPKQMNGFPVALNRTGRDQRRRTSSSFLVVVVMSSMLAACGSDGGAESANAAPPADSGEPSMHVQPSGGAPHTIDGFPPELLAEILSAGAREAGT